MSMEDALAIGQQMLKVTMLVSAPLLGFSLLAGLIVSVFQALTQIQEMGLTFIIKIVVVAVVLVVFLPWMLGVLTDYTADLILESATFGR